MVCGDWPSVERDYSRKDMESLTSWMRVPAVRVPGSKETRNALKCEGAAL